jgi:hypothetical protein
MVAILASACGGTRYTASFNLHTKQPVNNQAAAKSENSAVEATSIAQAEQLFASTSNAPVEFKAEPKEEVRKTYIQMTSTERKALRTHLRSEIKSYANEQKKSIGLESTKATTGDMDSDLKLAAIFGAVGIVGLMLGGATDFFWIIGGIALLIGVVFFVKWLVRQ